MGLLGTARFFGRRSRGDERVCDHVQEFVRPVEPSSEGCAKCIQLGDGWVHLRLCLTCGEVGCCDSSPNQHAHKHADATGHPIVRSHEPGEDWWWCFVDEDVVGAGPIPGEA